jgi:hypothetical protein
MPDYRALLANCLINGEVFSNIGTQRIRDRINVQINNYNIEIVEHPDIITGSFAAFKGQAFYTTDLYVRNITAAQFPDVEIVCGEVAELLSFATSSPVAKFGYVFGADGFRTGVMGQTEYFRPAIDTVRGDLIRSFIEKTWPQYHIIKTTRRMNLSFSYYVLSQQSGQPMELLLVVTFVLLENLKHHFASDRGYPYFGGYFHRMGATRSNRGSNMHFEELLRKMFNEVGMNPSLTSIIALRNDLIHSGLSAKPYHEQTAIYDACQDIIREYVLRLLGYIGEYSPFSLPNSVLRI